MDGDITWDVDIVPWTIFKIVTLLPWHNWNTVISYKLLKKKKILNQYTKKKIIIIKPHNCQYICTPNDSITFWSQANIEYFYTFTHTNISWNNRHHHHRRTSITKETIFKQDFYYISLQTQIHASLSLYLCLIRCDVVFGWFFVTRINFGCITLTMILWFYMHIHLHIYPHTQVNI